MKDQPLLRDLKMQFPKTATSHLKAAEILCGPMAVPQASASSESKGGYLIKIHKENNDD